MENERKKAILASNNCKITNKDFLNNSKPQMVSSGCQTTPEK